MSARVVAMEVFARAFHREAYASELIDEVTATKPDLSPADRRLAVQLVLGVTRRRATLDAVLRHAVTRGLENVEPPLLDVLRLGAYQLLFLSQIPAHAAVHESVELAEWAQRPAARGFLNGALRKVSELTTEQHADSVGPDALPLDRPHKSRTQTARFRKLARPVFPDPRGLPVEYLADAFSWPRWLAARWMARHGFEECVRLGFHFNAPPPVWLRVNGLQGMREAYRVQLLAAQIDADPGPNPFALRLRETVPIKQLPGFNEGLVSVQDVASMAVAQALAPDPHWRILDLCSAPGGKTTHLAELMRDQGRIDACDIRQDRLATVAKLAKRLQLKSIHTHLVPGDAPPRLPAPGEYDAALVDVPCSNTGVLGRRPEVRWRLSPNEFPHLITLQTRLLLTALEAVKPGGVVVYSTCSIEPDENRGVVEAARRSKLRFSVEGEQVSIPGQPSDGGYWCRLRRAG